MSSAHLRLNFAVLNVEPKTYRFRILNAADDRFVNLQLYQAYDPNTATVGTGTEVKMVPAIAATGFPSYWPKDGREGGVPDPATRGPSFIQIGTEGGFLPAPVVLPIKPINWNYDQTNFDFGNVNQGTLILGTAERADVLVDFSAFAGKTLILYNDSPAPFPAIDLRYDYYTGKPDLTDTGGSPTTLPGYGPNTRTIMQIRVAASPVAPAYNVATLNTVFAKTGVKNGVFDVSQDQIIVPNANYNSAYNTTFPVDQYSRIADTSKTFQTVPGNTVTIPMQPKAMHDEMGGVFDIDYGRQSAMLGMEVSLTSAANQNFVVFPYVSPPVELIKGSVFGTPIGSAGDGTQIWKITHNGVDTHTIHFHLYNVQLINRVAWDGALRLPDPTELGWKETLRVSPLQDTFVALRPIIPTSLPFPVPNSVHLLDETTGVGDALRPPPPIKQWADPTGEPITAGILNHVVNFGWEYVYHCHLLAHEEMDMMHSQVFAVPPEAPTDLGFVVTTGPDQVALAWNDNSIGETGFTVYRADNSGFTDNVTFTVGPNVTSYLDATILPATTYYYKVLANNMVGDTADYTPAVFEHFSVDSAFSNTVATDQASPPMPPVLSLPADTAIVGTLTPTLEWNASTGADSYGVQVSTRNDFVTTVLSQTGITDLFLGIPVSTLNWNTTYYWRVNATNGTGTSAWSTVWSFTPAQVTPIAPVLASPADLSTLNTLTPWLHWNEATGAASYGVQVSADSGFGTTLINQAGIDRLCFNIPVGTLAFNNTYFWRVNAANANGTSGWSTPWSFTLQLPPPPTPVLLSPADTSILNTMAFSLDWSPAIGADSYGVQVSIDPNFGSTVINQTGITAVSFNIPGATLSWNSTYYWRVNATNLGGTSAWSAPWSFRIVPTVQKLIGADDATATATAGGNYIVLDRWAAVASGNVTQIRVKCTTTGNVKVAMYTDSAGNPGTLINANNTGAPVVVGWNTITLPPTAVTSGQNYWLAYNSSANCVGDIASPGGILKYGALGYGSNFPASPGTLATAGNLHSLSAGWGMTGATVPLVINTTSLPDGTVNSAYSQTLLASGGATPYTWLVVVGTPPAGLTLDGTGVLSGMPAAVGTSTFTVQVSDATSSANQAFTLNIMPQVSKLIGADDATATGMAAGNYLLLDKWTAVASGNVTQIRIKASVAGNVKVALYDDSGGAPGALKNANNTGAPVVVGWNTITLPSTAVTAGTTYWIAYNCSNQCLGNIAFSGGMLLYRPFSYATNFPASAGTGFTTYADHHSLTAGWGN